MTNTCLGTHETLTVDTLLGPMQIYDYEKYKNVEGYCSGKDDVSRTLINEGAWEKTELKEIQPILAGGDRNKYFVDIGAHIGWYSKMAQIAGYPVIAYECDPENIRLFKTNVERVTPHQVWIDETTELDLDVDIELIKIDIEGNELYAIDAIEHLLKDRRIEHIYMEVSPVFRSGYKELITKIVDYGYDATIESFPYLDIIDDINQSNCLLKKI